MKRRLLTVLLFFVLIGQYVLAQNVPNQEEKIAALAFVKKDSILIRWAPKDARTWITANQTGYSVERITLVRGTQVLNPVERQVIATNILPAKEADWEPIVKREPKAVIAAQALWGSKFEMDFKKAGIVDIVNKSKENEQRFSFAMFTADQSREIAKGLGLFLVDPKPVKGERYLYRIISQQNGEVILGSVFVSADELTVLPAPLVTAVKETTGLVELSVSTSLFTGLYTHYSLERSIDSVHFKPVTDIPFVQVSPRIKKTDQLYLSDTIPVNIPVMYYRVKGWNPFGEAGPASAKVKVKRTYDGFPPQITSVISSDNKVFTVKWDYPVTQSDKIKGFWVERAAASQGDYKSLHPSLLPSTERTYTDVSPLASNYYRVVAQTADGRKFPSLSFFSHKIDSIPPGIPTGLKGIVNDQGEIQLQWDNNKDEDISGYRIYRASFAHEEPSQLTSSPVLQNGYSDKADLKTLNKSMFYYVMAIDRSQNHSALSLAFELKLPDQVPPQPPLLYPVTAKQSSVQLTWKPSPSPDVVRYEVYQQDPIDPTQWMMVKTVVSQPTDTLFTYEHLVESKQNKIYTVVALDDSGNESEPASPMNGRKIPALENGPVIQEPLIDRQTHRITLSWIDAANGAMLYQLYKGINEGDFKLFRTLPANTKQWSDQDIKMQTRYRYFIVTVFNDRSKSKRSSIIETQY